MARHSERRYQDQSWSEGLREAIAYVSKHGAPAVGVALVIVALMKMSELLVRHFGYPPHGTKSGSVLSPRPLNEAYGETENHLHLPGLRRGL